MIRKHSAKKIDTGSWLMKWCVKAYIYSISKMNSDGWTTVHRGRGVPFPDTAAAAFGNRRSAVGSNERVRSGRNEFDSNAASAFGRKQQPRQYNDAPASAPKRYVEKKVELELSNETLFPSLGESKAPSLAHDTIENGSKTAAAWGSSSESSFASIMKARAEADKREMEERELAERKRIEEREREKLDVTSYLRSHRLGRRYGGAGYSDSYEEEEYVDDENSLDYRHPYEMSYRDEYSADALHCDEQDDASLEEEEEQAHDNSAW